MKKKILSLFLAVLMIAGAFIAVPVTVSAESTPNFLAPITGTVQGTGYDESAGHYGIDLYPYNYGDPVYAVASGTIMYSCEKHHTKEYQSGDDCCTVKIILDEPFMYNGIEYVCAFYTHMSSLVYDVYCGYKPGCVEDYNAGLRTNALPTESIHVEAGDLIGYVGKGNGATHLHFSFEASEADGYAMMPNSEYYEVFGWEYNGSITANRPSTYEASSFDPVWPCATAWQITTNYFYRNYYHESLKVTDVTRHGTRSNSYNSDGYLNAIDISGGGNILATEAGTVTESGVVSDFGEYIVIKHKNGMYSLYGHLSSRSVSKGQTVSKGNVIGVMGSTGNSTGTHLHFELYGENYSVTNPFKTYFEAKYRSKIKIGTNSKAAAEKVLGQNWAYTTSGAKMTPSSLAKETLTWYIGILNQYYSTQSGGWYYYNGSTVTPSTSCNCSTSYAGSYICTTSSAPLRIRSGHGTNYSDVGTIPSGATVTVSKANGSWAHVTYNGVSGCASMSYLAKIEPLIDGYPLPFKACPLATGETAAEALWSDGSVRGYIYGTDDCTIKKIYSSGMCLLNCEYNGTYQDIYAYINDFLYSTATPTQKTVEAYAITYYRSTGSDERGWIDAGDKVYVIGTSGSRTQVIYPHTDGTYRCAWVDTSAITHTHTPGAAATCISPQVCTKCDAVLAPITSEHTWDSGYVSRKPSCVQTGNLTKSCTLCGTVKDFNIEIDPTAHSWNEGYVSREPTCIQTGNLTKTCTSCGISQNFNIEIVPNAHKWDNGTVTKAATCTSTGVKTYRCINMLGTVQCTTTKTETIPMISHSYGSWTDYDSAYHIRRCSCGEWEKVAHSWGDWTNKNSTTHYSQCSVCLRIKENAHQWDSGVVTKEPTCSSTGIMTYTCISDYCGATKTETIPVTEHPWSDTVYYEESHPHKGYRICSPCVENGVREILYTGTTQTRATCSDCHPVTSVTLNKTTATITVGKTLTLTATVNPADAANKNVTWKSSDTTVATVSTGVVTAKKAGTATITAMTADGSKTATCIVTVKAATVITAQAEIGAVSSSAGKTVEVPVRFTANPGVASFYFEFEYDHTKLHLAGIKNGADFSRAINTSLDNPNYVEDGTIAIECASVKNFTGTGEIFVITFEVLETTPNGIYNVNCISSTGANHSMESVVFYFTNGAVTVNNTINVESVTLNKSSATLTEGDTLTLTATVAPTNATNKNVTWKSSDTTVATVSNGVVTAKKAGTATITVTTADGSKTATCMVTVKAAFDPDALTFTVGSAKAIAGKTVTVGIVISNNPGIAGFSFKVGYDSSVMTLIGYDCPGWTANSSGFDEDPANNPVGFSWSRTTNYTSNKTILTLTFEIKADAPAGEYDISLTTTDVVTNQDKEKLKFNLVGGKITVVESEPGDLSGDGDINSIDAVLLAQYIAGWDVEIDGIAADCNGDGEINSIDAVLLAQYIAGWDVVLG